MPRVVVIVVIPFRQSAMHMLLLLLKKKKSFAKKAFADYGTGFILAEIAMPYTRRFVTFESVTYIRYIQYFENLS